MQKIQKFQFGRLYATPKSTKTYELIDRYDHLLVFRVRNSKTRDCWKFQATSTYKADASGAFEEVLFYDGVSLRADALLPERKRKRYNPSVTKEGIFELMKQLAA